MREQNKSSILHKELDKLAYKLKEKERDYLKNHPDIMEFYKYYLSGNEQKEIKELFNKFIETFKELYTQCAEDNYLWQYCPFEVYKKNIGQYKDEYINEYIDATDIDFYKIELKELISNYQGMKDKPHPYKSGSYLGYPVCFIYNFKNNQPVRISYMLDESLVNKIKYTNNKKIEYCKALINNPEYSNKDQETIIDFSDNSDAEKIVILHELKVLDFLKKIEPFNTSTNKLAEVISSFTGINSSTVQSYINPMNNSSVSQKNNPVKKEKNVKLAQNKLVQMGINKKDLKTDN